VLTHRAADYLAQIPPLTEARGVDVILEMLANVNLGKDLGVLARQGRVVVIGSRGPVQIDPRDTMARDASIFGMLLFNVTDADAATIHAALYAGFDNGTLRPVVGQELPLDQAPRAHQVSLQMSRLAKQTGQVVTEITSDQSGRRARQARSPRQVAQVEPPHVRARWMAHRLRCNPMLERRRPQNTFA
jgi:NADPH:quinone reductase-like Zn-dependent oxidoreductase